MLKTNGVSRPALLLWASTDFKTSRLYYKFSKEYFYKCPGSTNSCTVL